MDNRFNIKDVVMIVLVLGVGGLVLLSMWGQDRRQWDVLQETLSQLKEQRESVDIYKRELSQMKIDQDALRGGVEKMTENVGTMTDGVRELNSGVAEMVEVLKTRPAQGGTEGLGSINQGLPDGNGGVTFSAEDRNDKTFDRVAQLSEKPDFAEGDYFIDVFGSTVKNLTPYISGDVYATRIGSYVMESLLTVDPVTLEHQPWIAKSWDISDDGLVYTFHMRDDVVFSDGEPMDSSDVVFTYNWVMNPQVAAPRMRSQLDKVESVKALDKYTVQFTFREPYFLSLTVAGLYLQILPEHWVSQFTEDEYNEMPGLVMGSGPYMLDVDPKEWEPATQKITLVRNDNHWGPRPPLDRIIWREILEPTAQLTAFRNREVDRFGVRASMYRELSTDEQLRDQAHLLEYTYVSRGYSYIGWNQEKNGQPTAFANKLVRQAMTHLIDRDGITGQIFENLANTATGPFHPLGWQGDPSIEPWPYDPERAKALLDEAGYKDRDNNGVRESPQGEPLSFEFIYSTGGTESKDVAIQIKASMAKAGVEVKPVAMDWPVMQQKLDDRKFDSIMLGWGGAFESDLYQIFHSDQIQDGGDNYTSYRSPEFDKLVEAARTTLDRDEGQKLWWKAHKQLHEDQPYTFMMNPKSVVLMDKRVKNVEITKLGLSSAWEYYVPKGMQLHTGE